MITSKNKTEALQIRSMRGSKYRGVSKNGFKWQIMVVSGRLKKYIGAIGSQVAAGILYDKYSIIIKGVLKVSKKSRADQRF